MQKKRWCEWFKPAKELLVSLFKWFGSLIKRLIALIIKNIWYVILLSGSSIYVWFNISKINQFEKFNLENLVFVLWLLLLLLPLFSEMELFGIKLKKEIEKVKQENKEEIKELRQYIQTISISSNLSNHVEVTNTIPLPNKEGLQESKSELKKDIGAEPEQKAALLAKDLLEKIPEDSVYLFQVRLVVEDLMYKLAVNCGYNGGKNSFPQMLEHLTRNEYLNNRIIESLQQVRTICNRGVHGEIVSDDYLDYVKEAYPFLVRHFNKALHESVANFTSCNKCGYNGPSRHMGLCPKCGKNNLDD